MLSWVINFYLLNLRRILVRQLDNFRQFLLIQEQILTKIHANIKIYSYLDIALIKFQSVTKKYKQILVILESLRLFKKYHTAIIRSRQTIPIFEYIISLAN